MGQMQRAVPVGGGAGCGLGQTEITNICMTLGDPDVEGSRSAAERRC